MSATVTAAQQSTVLRSSDSAIPSDGLNDPVLQGIARGDRQGTFKLHGIPSFSDPLAKRRWIRQHMAAVFRYFGKQGYVEGTSGHISVRDPILQDHFWMNPFATHFSLIKASDMVLVDSQGYVVEGGNQAMINEAGFWIHSEVHHARPDIMAVAHAHSQYGRAWSAFGKPIEMLDQDTCNLYGKISVYDDHGGVALAQEEGRAIANALGKDSMVCILQNHGLITCGTTVDEAAFLFYDLDRACHTQLLVEAAAANGLQKKVIPHAIAQYSAKSMQSAHNFYNEFQPEYNLIVAESKGEVLQ